MQSQDYLAISHFLAEIKVELIISLLSKCNPDWMQGPFTPTYSKIYYITEGEGRMMIGDTELFPKPGQWVFAPAGLSQFYSVTDADRTYRMYWCHFTSNISFINLFSLFKLPYCFDARRTDDVVASFERLIEGYKGRGSGPAQSLRIQAALLDVISCYIEQAVQAKPQTPSHLSSSKLGSVLQYIDTNLQNDLSVAELAELVHHHPNYFIRFFKNHMGMTPMAFIYERRLEKAKQLLLSSDLAIGEIAQATGFHDIFHFSKSFKKRLGVAPSEFRSWPRAAQKEAEEPS
ncbi:AraC family transcriptional regulator [Paenibacillus doosanensis]|uniref:Bifunctional transcriptional activator/DNA repair enzyme AdaA n=1 Tax=Paenibacillus konkukensis TaxID=2020716 RepID=A0ABY4RIK1_9BACL|nr:MULTISPECIES: AraC family transcriptional regulator [Paenibacillus]MCS7463916.1 AraC family transcriptional regulator [Paenibacillus doosanensis]UQZ82251.1 Bifunctional transcriptional activator/DNA repair enzyme AdaA [Paenibacillus konkukensis]